MRFAYFISLLFPLLALAEETIKVKIDELKPTQFALGFVDMETKRETLRELKDKKKKLEKYLQNNLAKFVIGPGGQVYLVDRHHLSRALYEEGFKKIEGIVLDDFSKLSEEEFWKKMKEKKYLWMFDENGKSVANISSLPKHVKELKNDPYRSLSWVIRERGAFVRSEVPFTEFMWANFLRTRVDVGSGKKDFENAVEKAIPLATSKDAEKLPGFTGKYAPCSFYYSWIK